jgi:hypothetical protein
MEQVKVGAASEGLTVTGTHQQTANPWDTYGNEMKTVMSPEVAAAVAEYAERQYDYDSTSNQNKEALAEEKELSDAVASQYQWVTPEEYADLEQRIGRVMSHAEFITLLRKAGVICHYLAHPHPDKARLMVAKDVNSEATLACWVQIGQMPELSIMNFDDHGAPLAERRRGWRTPLLQLILKGLISEAKANITFGRPKQSEAFHRYNAMLLAFRNAGNSLQLS